MIGKNLGEIRKSRGLSLSELSERTGISKSYLSYIERNMNKNPSIQILEKISNVLRVDLKELIHSDKESQILQHPEKEWLDFIAELKKSGIEKEDLQDYQQLIDFINWKKRLENKS
jgi:XRE family transcriptional regulator, master regulator for biofilm formation